MSGSVGELANVTPAATITSAPGRPSGSPLHNWLRFSQER